MNCPSDRHAVRCLQADRDRHGDALLFVSSAQPIGAICAAVAAAPVSAPPVRLDAAAAESLGFGGFVRASAASRRQAGEALPPLHVQEPIRFAPHHLQVHLTLMPVA